MHEIHATAMSVTYHRVAEAGGQAMTPTYSPYRLVPRRTRPANNLEEDDEYDRRIDPLAGWEVGTNRVPVEEPPPLTAEHDLDDLEPERAAHMFGRRAVAQIEEQAPSWTSPTSARC